MSFTHSESDDTPTSESSYVCGVPCVNKPIDWATQLKMAIETRSVWSVKELIAKDESLASFMRFGLTPLHLCISLYCGADNKPLTPIETDIINAILPVIQHQGFIDGWDSTGVTALHCAIRSGHIDIVHTLLKAGAAENNTSYLHDTALHVAVKHPEILKHFLNNYQIENSKNAIGYAPIHNAVEYNEVESIKLLLKKFGHDQLDLRTNYGQTVLHVAAYNNSIAAAQFLLSLPQTRLNIHSVDKDFETALYKAAEKDHELMTAMLLRNGAALSDKGKTGKTVVKEIATKFSDPLAYLEGLFDECIYETVDADGAKVLVRYEILLNRSTFKRNQSQIKVTEELVRCGLRKLLVHPLLQSILCLKWRSLLPVFYSVVVIYVAFLAVLNTYILACYKIDKDDETGEVISANASITIISCAEKFGGWYWVVTAVLYFTVFLLLTQEFAVMCLQKRYYFVDLEAWVKFSCPVIAALVPVVTHESMQQTVACAALLLAWLQAMLLLSRFSGWGYYVFMLGRVAANILKILLTSTCLLIGFSLSFMILYEWKPPFESPVSAFIKTFVMMSSEIDYLGFYKKRLDDRFGDSDAIVCLLFVAFVIFVAIVLMNFMIGVAVSDINELSLLGHVGRLEKQLELLCTLDVIIESIFGKLRKSLICHHNSIERYTSSDGPWLVDYSVPLNKTGNEQTMWQKCIERTRPETQTLSKEVEQGIINVARKVKRGREEDKVKNENNNKLNTLYDEVMGASLPKLSGKINAIEDTIRDVNLKGMRESIDSLEVTMKEILAIIKNKNNCLDDRRKNLKLQKRN